ncbi:MAG TPA: hypothetical protein VMT45_14750, partial [Thermoanaerobaculaceae bacterium]|nr:hypothetical protein [Thermoanaerobaculaceae bacterium]
INYVITTIVNTYGTNQRIRVAVTGGSGRVITNASRLDNRTGDPATIEMVGGGREGTYVSRLERTDYKTPLTLTVAQGAVTALDVTILFTDADVASCTDIQLAAFSGPLSQPVYYDETGSFSFVVSNPNVGGIGISLQISGTISVTAQVSGTMTTTVTGAGTCSGSKAWPFAGAKVR